MKRNTDVRGHYVSGATKAQKKLEEQKVQKAADEALLTWVITFGDEEPGTATLTAMTSEGGAQWLDDVLRNGYVKSYLNWDGNWAKISYRLTQKANDRLKRMKKEEAEHAKAEARRQRITNMVNNVWKGESGG